MLEKRGNYWYGEKWFLCSSKNGFCLALVCGCFVVDFFFLTSTETLRQYSDFSQCIFSAFIATVLLQAHFKDFGFTQFVPD